MDALSWLRDAIPRAPAVAARVRAAGLGPTDLQTADDLRHFPTIDRAQWREDWRDLAAWDARWAPTWEVARSSGSTGDPVSVVRDRRDVRHMWTVLRRLGVPVDGSVTALWCTLPTGRRFDHAGPFGRILRIPASARDAVLTIEAARPTILFSDPAGWCAWISDPPRVRPAAALSSASQLSPAVRRLAEDVLGTQIIDYWSTTETGPIAVSCGRGHHVLTDDVIVEEDSGELLVTRVRPGASVVLRWRSGDHGEVASGCPCGHSGPTILGLRGRRAVWFSRPDGTTVDAWSLAPALKTADILGFRLTQVGASAFELESASAGVAPVFAAALRQLGWERPTIALSPPPPPQGKPEPFRGGAW